MDQSRRRTSAATIDGKPRGSLTGYDQIGRARALGFECMENDQLLLQSTQARLERFEALIAGRLINAADARSAPGHAKAAGIQIVKLLEEYEAATRDEIKDLFWRPTWYVMERNGLHPAAPRPFNAKTSAASGGLDSHPPLIGAVLVSVAYLTGEPKGKSARLDAAKGASISALVAHQSNAAFAISSPINAAGRANALGVCPSQAQRCCF